MMKKLLAMSLFLMSMTTMFAQDWNVGDDITDQIGWDNLSFEAATKDPWQFESVGGNVTQTGGLFELYEGSEADLYQYVELPAGMYKVECQGYYRCGNSWADDPSVFNTADWEDNALLYVQNGKYDIESNEFAAGRTFTCPLMPRLFPMQDTQLYVGPKEGEDGYPGWDMSDGSYLNGTVWGPCSVPGSLVWFQNGLYGPYDEGEEDVEGNPIRYNTVTFFVLEPGFVRIGVTKKNPRTADSFMVTNFKMYYTGKIEGDAELIALQSDVQSWYNQVKALPDKVDNDAFTELVGVALDDFDTEFGSIDYLTKEECSAATAYLQNVYTEANASLAALQNLDKLVRSAEILYNATDYAGKAAFDAVLTKAKNIVDNEYVMSVDDDFSLFQNAYDDLNNGRMTYILSQEAVNGKKDFSAFIVHRFFTNEENNPVWSDETNFWEYDPELKAAYPEFFDAMEFDGGNETQKAQRAKISGDVVLKSGDNSIPFQWYKTGTGGPGWEVYYDHKMTSCKAWAPTPTSGISIIGQLLTGLPNGYYSMSGMAEAWTNEGVEASDNHFIISSGDQSSRSERAEPRAWWNGNTNASWNFLSTDMIEVKDGTVRLEASLNGFYSITGFQLFYYGTTPDFNALLASRIAEAQEKVKELKWQGDKAAANAILANLPADINSSETFQQAQEVLTAIDEYVSAATAAYKQMDTIIDNYGKLAAAQEDGSAEGLIASTALVALLVDEDEEDAVYTWVADFQKDYEAYVAYFDYRAAMGDLPEKNAELGAAIAEQNNYLVDNYATAAQLEEFTAALAAPYNKAVLLEAGMAEATEENPVDVTILINNPNFDEGQKGWSGTEITVTGPSLAVDLGTVEVWNKNFDVYQTIYSLPAGWYGIDAQACYRDAGDAKNAYNNWWYNAIGEMEFWENPNAKLYANDNETTIVSIASEQFEDQSMTAFRDQMVKAEEGDEQGNDVWIEHWKTLEDMELPAEAWTKEDGTQWYWDTKIEDLEEVYYYPASLTGMTKRFEKNPEAYHNQVFAAVEEGGSLTFGVRKTVELSGDWLCFDNFKLYYYGPEKPAVAINEITTANNNGAAAIFGINGARQNTLMKGLNIVKKADGTVSKVFVK